MLIDAAKYVKNSTLIIMKHIPIHIDIFTHIFLASEKKNFLSLSFFKSIKINTANILCGKILKLSS